MKKKVTSIILSSFSLLLVAGIMGSDVMASPSKSDSDKPVPKEIKKAREYQRTHELKPVEIQTVDVYGDKGNYIVTVPIDVWKKNETKGMAFWKSHAKEFVEKFNMPTSDPEGLTDWSK